MVQTSKSQCKAQKALLRVPSCLCGYRFGLVEGRKTFSPQGHDGTRRKNRTSVVPFPVLNFGHVLAAFTDVLLVFNEFVAQKLLEMSADTLQLGNAIDNVSS
jgi:hypothetical protein